MSEASSETSFDAKSMNEEIKEGEAQEPKVNVESDYEHSKAFATSETDSEDATSASGSGKGKLGGEQQEFQEMAKELTPDEE